MGNKGNKASESEAPHAISGKDAKIKSRFITIETSQDLKDFLNDLIKK